MKRIILSFCCLSMFMLATDIQAQPWNCLVAYYSFSGNAADSSGNGFHGTPNGGSYTTDRYGIANSAYSFDGINDYISVTHDSLFNFEVNDTFSISLWFKAGPNQLFAGNGYNDLLVKYSESGTAGDYPYSIQLLNQTSADPGNVRASRQDNSCANFSDVSGDDSFNDGQFHHLVFVKNGSDLLLYVDNQLRNTSTDASLCNTENNNSLFIGKRGGSTNPNLFQGTLDDIMIFNCALSEADIDTMFCQLQIETNGRNVKCYGQNNGMVEVDATGGFPPVTYQWNIGSTFDSVPNRTAGQYFVTVTDGAGCTRNDSVTITEPDPLVHFMTVTDYASEECDVTASIFVQGGRTPYSYFWDPINQGGDEVSGLCPGAYTVYVYDSAGCTISKTFYVGDITGINNYLSDKDFTIFPNPAYDRLNLSFSGFSQDVNAELINVLGQVVWDNQLQPYSTSEIDISSFKRGIYILRLRSGSGIIQKRVLLH